MGTNPAVGRGSGDDYPVYNVSWFDCQEFIERLNTQGYGSFRLPSVQEWLYAYKSEAETLFYWGDDPDFTEIDQYAWYLSNASYSTQPIGTKTPNNCNLYDMTGNVWEWCVGQSGNYRTRCGGGWDTSALNLSRHQHTSYYPANSSNNNLGLRLVIQD